MSEMKENKAFGCAVARDLMPLYVENLTEDETTEWMRQHIAACPACAQSFGMQKTKLEIEKKPQRPDFRGIRFFKKSFLKRIALVMAVAIMSVMILIGGYSYLFDSYSINNTLLHVVGQYELTDGRIAIALQAKGYAVNGMFYNFNEWEDVSYYDYADGQRVIRSQTDVRINVNGHLSTSRFLQWTRKEDDRGSVFYYLFDPGRQSTNHASSVQGFIPVTATPSPTNLEAAQPTAEEIVSPTLYRLEVNNKVLWRAGDPLRKLTAEEEEVLLRTMENAGFIGNTSLLPQVDIIDSLMGK